MAAVERLSTLARGQAGTALALPFNLLDQNTRVFLPEEQPVAVCPGDSPGPPSSLQEYFYKAKTALPGRGARDAGSDSHALAARPMVVAYWDQRPQSSQACPQLIALPHETYSPTPNTVQYTTLALPACPLPCPPLSRARLASPRAGGGRREREALRGPPPDPGLPGMLQGSEPDTKSHGSHEEGCSGASGPLFC